MHQAPAICHPDDASQLATIDEERLLAGLLRGEEDAWRTFHEHYAAVMLRAILRVKNRFPAFMSTDDVSDIYADLCLQLLSQDKRRLRQFEPARGTPLCVWLGVLARHAAYDFLRVRRRQPAPYGIADDVLDTDAPPPAASDPFRDYCTKERARILAALIEELSPRDREFVVLYYCEGLDPEETAERLGICVSTVYSKKHKIRARIEGLLEKRWAA